jgi:hypothetical protein
MVALRKGLVFGIWLKIHANRGLREESGSRPGSELDFDAGSCEGSVMALRSPAGGMGRVHHCGVCVAGPTECVDLARVGDHAV